MNPLKRFSDAELLAELVRRKNATDRAKPEYWCHNCDHYRAWNEIERGRAAVGRFPEMPDDYNPCTKGHQMKFVVPEDYPDDNDSWGYYRTVCEDRSEVA